VSRASVCASLIDNDCTLISIAHIYNHTRARLLCCIAAQDDAMRLQHRRRSPWHRIACTCQTDRRGICAPTQVTARQHVQHLQRTDALRDHQHHQKATLLRMVDSTNTHAFERAPKHTRATRRVPSAHHLRPRRLRRIVVLDHKLPALIVTGTAPTTALHCNLCQRFNTHRLVVCKCVILHRSFS
jgi:hypothetical protein